MKIEEAGPRLANAFGAIAVTTIYALGTWIGLYVLSHNTPCGDACAGDGRAALTEGLRPLTFAFWATVTAIVAMFAVGIGVSRPWRWIGLTVLIALLFQVVAVVAALV